MDEVQRFQVILRRTLYTNNICVVEEGRNKMAEQVQRKTRLPCIAIVSVVLLSTALVLGITLGLLLPRATETPPPSAQDALVDCLPGKVAAEDACKGRR